jgi:hypothetical protein
MKRESWFFGLLNKFLKWVDLIHTYEINKKEMCEKSKSTCNGNCESCLWNEWGINYGSIKE